jgi:ABC-type polysaccharide/polyol phosphate export permease
MEVARYITTALIVVVAVYTFIVFFTPRNPWRKYLSIVVTIVVIIFVFAVIGAIAWNSVHFP